MVHKPADVAVTVYTYIIREKTQGYLCSAKASILEGSESRRLYSLKGTSVEPCLGRVRCTCRSSDFLLLKTGLVGSFAEGNSAQVKQSRRLLL